MVAMVPLVFVTLLLDSQLVPLQELVNVTLLVDGSMMEAWVVKIVEI